MAKRNKYPPYPEGVKAETKMGKVMREWKAGKLHSGSKRGPIVEDQAQAVAIGLSQARKVARGKHKARG